MPNASIHHMRVQTLVRTDNDLFTDATGIGNRIVFRQSQLHGRYGKSIENFELLHRSRHEDVLKPINCFPTAAILSPTCMRLFLFHRRCEGTARRVSSSRRLGLCCGAPARSTLHWRAPELLGQDPYGGLVVPAQTRACCLEIQIGRLQAVRKAQIEVGRIRSISRGGRDSILLVRVP